MNEESIIEQTMQFVKTELEGAEAGHDWWHIERVYKNALKIAASEPVNLFVVRLAALLHDIADAKFHGGDENAGPNKAGKFLRSAGVPPETTDHVENIIRHLSFKGGNVPVAFHSGELAVVQDADRLDALGAIGIARAFHYGGYRNRELYHPDRPPDMHLTKETYRSSTAPTLNHFYEKLLLLKDRMHTATGRTLAENRHAFLERFLEEFLAEWQGER